MSLLDYLFSDPSTVSGYFCLITLECICAYDIGCHLSLLKKIKKPFRVFLKKKKRRLTTSLESDDNHLANQLKADVYFDGNEIQRKLQLALDTLPEKQRLVFNMRYFDEMPYKDISDVLGTSVGGLKASYHHAVKKIEQFLKG